MSPFTVLLLCTQAYLIQGVFGNNCGKSIDISVNNHDAGCDYFTGGRGLGSAGYAGGFAGDYGIDSRPVGKGYASAGHSAYAAYGAIGEGELAVSGELPFGGNTRVAGQVPVVGDVCFSGSVPAAGQVSLCAQCGCDCHQHYNYY